MTATTPHRRRYGAADPRRRAAGWLAVIALHAIILWALVTGTARNALQIIKKPMEAVVIQEVIIPPPPPPPPPPPKKIEKPEPRVEKAPPPPFVPPPEVTPPVTSAPTIRSVPTPPPEPAVIAPPPPPAPPAAPPGPRRLEIGVACPTMVKPEMPRQAMRDHTEGVVKAQVVIRDGVVKEVTILSGPRVFHNAVREAMLQYKCVSEGGDVTATQEFNFTVQ